LDRAEKKPSPCCERRYADGQPFTAARITLDDLGKFRDQRGTTQGEWTITIHGQSDPEDILGFLFIYSTLFK
jgi:hypothetical protein